MELAALLPFLTFVSVVAVDYARVFYFAVTVDNAARSGAIYGSLNTTNSTDTQGIQNAALADATNLPSAPTVSSTTATDANGNPQVQVTVTYGFNTITNYPGIPASVTLTRTVAMRVLPP